MIGWVSGCGICHWSFSGKVGAYAGGYCPYNCDIQHYLKIPIALSSQFFHCTQNNVNVNFMM